MYKEEDRKAFEEKLETLFNLASCTHQILTCTEAECLGCNIGAHLQNCTCKREKRTPTMELKFMESMREVRPPGIKAKMIIGGDDIKESKRQNKALSRKAQEEAFKVAATERAKAVAEDLSERKAEEEQLLQETADEGEEVETNYGDWDGEQKTRYTLKIPHTALAAIRYLGLLLQLPFLQLSMVTFF